MASKVQKVNWEDLPHEKVVSGYTRTGFGAEKGQLIYSVVEPGAGSTEPHVHDFDQFMMVVEGSFRMVLDGVEEIVNAGELLFIPAGVWHSGVAQGEDRSVTYDLFAPPRADYAHLHPGGRRDEIVPSPDTSARPN